MDMNYLLDTNIVSAILKKNDRANRKYQEALKRNDNLYIAGMTYYEVKRGLLYTNATRQMADFEDLCQAVPLFSASNELEILEKASEIHADLKHRGRPIQDADILIAATAIANNLTLVSNDTDMRRVAEVAIENWVKPR